MTQAPLRLVCEDREPQPLEAARAPELLRAADDRGRDPAGRDDGEGGEDQARVSNDICDKTKYYWIFLNNSQNSLFDCWF